MMGFIPSSPVQASTTHLFFVCSVFTEQCILSSVFDKIWKSFCTGFNKITSIQLRSVLQADF